MAQTTATHEQRTWNGYAELEAKITFDARHPEHAFRAIETVAAGLRRVVDNEVRSYAAGLESPSQPPIVVKPQPKRWLG